MALNDMGTSIAQLADFVRRSPVSLPVVGKGGVGGGQGALA